MTPQPEDQDRAESPVAANPFASPGGPTMEKEESPNVPSWRLLCISLVIGNVVNGLTSWTFYTSRAYSTPSKLLWVIPDLLYGLNLSLGIALLTHAITHRRLTKLAPGHWRLIAALALFTDQFLWWHTPFLLVPAILLAFAIFSDESRIWKVFTWLCALIYLIHYLYSYLYQIVSERYALDPFASMYDPTLVPNTLATFSLYWSSVIWYFLSMVAVILMLCGIQSDYRRGIRRDPFHYLGLILIAMSVLMGTAYYSINEQLQLFDY